MKNIARIFWADLKSFKKNVIAAVVAIGMALTPALYAWFNILGFWDPYNETGNLEVAVANTDEGYQSSLIPTKINAGEQIVTELRGNTEFKWEFVDENEAVEGVKSGKYYAALVIPQSFSADLLTIFSGEVKHADIVYYTNQKENAVAPKVTERGADQISTEINQEFTKAVAEVALNTTTGLMNFVDGDGVGNFAEKLNGDLSGMISGVDLAAEQAENFAELMDASAGLATTSGGVLGQLGRSGTLVQPILAQAESGMENGVKALEATGGIEGEIYTNAAGDLGELEGTAQGVKGALGKLPGDAETTLGDLAGLVSDWKGVLQVVVDGLEQSGVSGESKAGLVGRIESIIAELKTLEGLIGKAQAAVGQGSEVSEGVMQEIEAKLAAVKSEIDGLHSGYQQQIAEEVAVLRGMLTQAGATVGELSDEVEKMTGELASATESLAGGMNTTGDALHRTAELLRQVSGQLGAERDKLSLALASGDLDKVREIIGSNPENLAAFVAAPTKLTRIPVYAMANNGSAMTPFYTSLAIWVGSIFLVALMDTGVSEGRLKEIGLKMGVGRKVGKVKAGAGTGAGAGRENAAELKLSGVTPGQMYLGRYLIFLTFALIQATIVCVGDVAFLGTQCDNFGLFLLTGWVCALVFSLIVYTLTLSFDRVGECIAIILVVWQVAGAGGIFPVVLSAEIFQKIYPWLPFTHSMNAFEGAMAGVYGNQFAVSMGTLLLFTLPMLVLGLVLRRLVIRLNGKFQEKMEETGIL